MHYLITGGGGYLATHFIKLLLKQDHTYITTIDSGFSSTESIKLPSAPRQIRRFRSSTTNIDTVARAMEDVDVIYHMADRQDWEDTYRHPMRLVDSNVRGLTNVLCMAKRAGVDKLVYVSSTEVYGNLVGATENDSLMPVTMYGATKAAAEAICRGFYNTGMEVVILRLSNVWGGEGSHSVVNSFANECTDIFGDGDQSRDFIYLKDAIHALLKAKNWESAIYNIATGEEITINGLWRLMNGEQIPTYGNSRSNRDLTLRFCADISNTVQRTGWKPRVLLSELSGEEIKNLCKGDVT